jgi:hypothetical protein
MVTNDPKKSIYLYKQNGELWFHYDGGSDKLIMNPRIAQILNARITADRITTGYVQFDTALDAEPVEGRMAWKSSEDAITVGMPGGNVALQLGMELYIPRRVKNDTAAGMSNGNLVYISGGSGNNFTVALARANAGATSMPTIAMLTEDIAKDAKGYATTHGIVRDINTAAYTPGTVLWLDAATAGAYTDTMPVHPNYAMKIGTVLRQHATEGSIIVNIEAPMSAKCIAGGDDVTYEDLQVSISNVRVPTSNAPTERLYDHGISEGVTFPALGFALNNYIYFDVQSRHAMKLSSILDHHIHYTTPTDGTGKKFKFQLDVIAAPAMGNWAVPTGSPFSTEVTMAADYSNAHRLSEIADIPAVNTTVSTLYKCKLTRIAASEEEYAGEVYLEFTDCHYPKDSVGSRNEGSKG